MNWSGPAMAERVGRAGAIGLALACLVAVTSVAQAQDDRFVLDQGTTGSTGNYEQTFAAVEITATRSADGATYFLDARERNIPLAWEWSPGDTVTGTGEFTLTGRYDPASGQVSGRFQYLNSAQGTLTGSFGDVALVWSSVWSGEVSGTIDTETATLSFSGKFTDTCTQTQGRVVTDCSSSGSQTQTVVFRVSSPTASTVPGSAGGETMVVSGAQGEVFYSPADQADLEPAQRTWVRLNPDDRVALAPGVMLRTGVDGTLRLRGDTGAQMRLQPSTLFEIQPPPTATTSQRAIYGRLLEGLAWFYWESDAAWPTLEIETRRARVGIKGTEWQISETADATVVAVFSGVVELTDLSTGATTRVGPAQTARVDDAGLTVEPTEPTTTETVPDQVDGGTVAPADEGVNIDDSDSSAARVFEIVAIVLVVAAGVWLAVQIVRRFGARTG